MPRSIRQALMCHGDLSLYSFMWRDNQEQPKPLALMDHMCVDWDNLLNWATERSFSLYGGLLTNEFSSELSVSKSRSCDTNEITEKVYIPDEQ